MLIPAFFIVINVLTALLVIPQNLETFYLIFRSIFPRNKQDDNKKMVEITEYPRVSIHLPVYNEGRNVIDLLASISNLNYPEDKLEILVLDDSDDETRELIEKETAKLGNRGFFRVDICRRSSREGHKAGNLQNGMRNTEAPFIAVFDADFRPKPSFLKSTIPHMIKNPVVAAVQTNWSSYNEESSILTRFLALGTRHNLAMNAGRQQIGARVMINGSAFLVKAAALKKLGGWETDTLTEDLDLTIKLHANGYKIVYVEREVCPQQLVSSIPAFSRQQQRWTKGYSQCLRKHWKYALSDSHLMFIMTLYMLSILAVTNMVSLCLSVLSGGGELLFDPFLAPFLIFVYGLVTVSLMLNYLSYIMASARSFKQVMDSILLVLIMAVLGLGISYRLAIKNISGLFFKGGSFDRTIKIGQLGDHRIKMPFLAEILLLCLCTATVVVLWTDYRLAALGVISYLSLFIIGILVYLISAIKSRY